MNFLKKKITLLLLLPLLCCVHKEHFVRDVHMDKAIEYCNAQAIRTLETLDGHSMPRSIENGGKQWKTVGFQDWTSGFWPGILWYLYESDSTKIWRNEARKYTELLKPLSENTAIDHDLGFQVFTSYGNGYRLTADPEYKKVLLRTADTLAKLYNPKVGTLLSWPREVPGMMWPQHNTIMDNMINLELLFWASKNGGDRKLYDIAVRHAEVTMQNHFRADNTSYHVVIYDRETGKKIKALTHQGYSDESVWARGQAWAIYGYTMVYRETRDAKFLDFAHKVTRAYLDRLPKDLIPYWDFDDPQIPDAPRDASAAAVVASALLELSSYTVDETLKKEYLMKAQSMLDELGHNYQAGNRCPAFLLHSTGHKPAKSEVDASIIYADYYYLEALMRYKKLMNRDEAGLRKINIQTYNENK